MGIVALVGSPNVGKSTIFNRLIGQRQAIVDDERGITRDRMYGKAEWLTKKFHVIDTGGIEIENAPFQQQIRAQVELAIKEADVIVFVTDGYLGVTNDDVEVAKMLYKIKKPVIVAVNKVDDGLHAGSVSDFYRLGLGEPLPVSGEHGIGIGDLLDRITKNLPEKEELPESNATTFCIIGQPNVGKSSLVNALLNQERVIVSPISGTTRDSVDTPFSRNGKDYVVIDTAGLKKRGKIYEDIDRYAALRAFKAIERADIVLFVIDPIAGIREQDKHVVGYATEENKAIIIVVNKWDAMQKTEKTMDEFKKTIRTQFKFLDYAPIVFVSALTKSRIHEIFTTIDFVETAYNLRIPTNTINGIVQDAQIINEPPMFNGGRLKIFYANQVAIKPPTFVLFVNNPNYLHFSYKRYLENRIRESFNFDGTPIKLIFRERN